MPGKPLHDPLRALSNTRLSLPGSNSINDHGPPSSSGPWRTVSYRQSRSLSPIETFDPIPRATSQIPTHNSFRHLALENDDDDEAWEQHSDSADSEDSDNDASSDGALSNNEVLY